MKNLIYILLLTLFSCKSANDFYQGRVTDEDNQPLKGVIVSEDGKKDRQTQTDENGYFKLDRTPEWLGELVFSKHGYKTDTVRTVRSRAGEQIYYNFIYSDTTQVKLHREESKDLTCEQLLTAMVRSRNAQAFKTFGHQTVRVRLSDRAPEKLTIELYVVNNASKNPDDPKFAEHTVGWLEFHRPSKRLLDITNDPENPVILTYDSTLIASFDLFKQCDPAAEVPASSASTAPDVDVMLEEDILFNGKLTRFFSYADFEEVFGKADSIKLLKDEQPCTSIFDTEAPDDKYLFKNGSCFETHDQQVAVSEFYLQHGYYITYKGNRIDEHSSMQDLQKLFPNSVKNRSALDKEGKDWLIQLREDSNGISDGLIKLFLRNGKASLILWWFPC